MRRSSFPAIHWACSLGGDRFFLFLHTYEVHVPYAHGAFASASDAGRVPGTFDVSLLERIREGSLVLTEGERRYVADLYDDDVAEGLAMHVETLAGAIDSLAGALVE